MSGHRQKGKAMKRKRSWHHRGSGPDRAYAYWAGRLDRAMRRHAADRRSGGTT